MLVPIYILIFGFSPKHAIPLSNITVFGGAIANTLLNSRKRHPLADRPLVDWDLILVMEPLVGDLLLYSLRFGCFFCLTSTAFIRTTLTNNSNTTHNRPLPEP